MVHRHQLDGGHAELFQVLDRRLRRQRFVGPAQMRGDRRMAHREAAHVHLVDDRVVPRRARRPIVAPRERGIDDGRERRERRVVAGVERQVGVGVSDLVAEHLVAPANRTRHRLRVWIHDNLVGVESMSRRRFVRTVYTIAVELVRTDVGQEAVPDHVRVLWQRDALAVMRRVRAVEQAKLDLRRVR